MPGAKGFRAILTIKDAAAMSHESRCELADWLRLRASSLVAHGSGYDSIVEYECLVRRTDRECKQKGSSSNG